MSSTWYSITMADAAGTIIFNGYFSVDNTTCLVMSFYNSIDITFSNNIIITTVATFTNTTGSHDNTQSNNLFVNNIFPVGGQQFQVFQI